MLLPDLVVFQLGVVFSYIRIVKIILYRDGTVQVKIVKKFLSLLIGYVITFVLCDKIAVSVKLILQVVERAFRESIEILP